jgi:hypothetical protein
MDSNDCCDFLRELCELISEDATDADRTLLVENLGPSIEVEVLDLVELKEGLVTSSETVISCSGFGSSDFPLRRVDNFASNELFFFSDFVSEGCANTSARIFLAVDAAEDLPLEVTGRWDSSFFVFTLAVVGRSFSDGVASFCERFPAVFGRDLSPLSLGVVVDCDAKFTERDTFKSTFPIAVFGFEIIRNGE